MITTFPTSSYGMIATFAANKNNSRKKHLKTQARQACQTWYTWLVV
jgi:hypothetical protein